MYGSSIWTLSSRVYFDIIFKFQKCIARAILDPDSRARTVPLFNELKWLPFYEEATINRDMSLYKRV